MMKPLSTGCETNPARNPRRSTPAPTVMRPVTRASPAVSAAARPAFPPTNPATTTPDSTEVADIGPTTKWRELPSAAYSTSAAGAAHKPTTGGTPASTA